MGEQRVDAIADVDDDPVPGGITDRDARRQEPSGAMSGSLETTLTTVPWLTDWMGLSHAR